MNRLPDLVNTSVSAIHRDDGSRFTETMAHGSQRLLTYAEVIGCVHGIWVDQEIEH